MRPKLREKTRFGQSLHNFTQAGSEVRSEVRGEKPFTTKDTKVHEGDATTEARARWFKSLVAFLLSFH
jgi:hypothetical protein